MQRNIISSRNMENMQHMKWDIQCIISSKKRTINSADERCGNKATDRSSSFLSSFLVIDLIKGQVEKRQQGHQRWRQWLLQLSDIYQDSFTSFHCLLSFSSFCLSLLYPAELNEVMEGNRLQPRPPDHYQTHTCYLRPTFLLCYKSHLFWVLISDTQQCSDGNVVIYLFNLFNSLEDTKRRWNESRQLFFRYAQQCCGYSRPIGYHDYLTVNPPLYPSVLQQSLPPCRVLTLPSFLPSLLPPAIQVPLISRGEDKVEAPEELNPVHKEGREAATSNRGYK